MGEENLLIDTYFVESYNRFTLRFADGFRDVPGLPTGRME